MRPSDQLVVNPRFQVEVVSPASALLMNELEHVAVRGAFAVEALRSCRTPIVAAELRDRLGDRFSPLEITIGLSHLVDRRHLVLVAPTADPADAFFARAGVDRVRQPTVDLQRLGPDDGGLLAESFRSLGVAIVEPDAAPALTVVAVDDYLRAELAERNATQLASGRPWALVRTGGVVPWIGPILVPGATGCWSCLAARLRDNRPVETYLRRVRDDDHDVYATPVSVPASRSAAAHLAALTLTQWLHGSATVRPGVLTTLDLRDLGTARHPLTRLTHCPACGTPPVRRVTRPRIEPAPALGARDGGLRTVGPDATLARLERHISPITGLVHRVSEYDTGDDLLTVHRAVHPLFTATRGLDSLRESLECSTAGKGRTSVQSRASALGEALERLSGRFEGHEVDRRAAWSELTDPAVHPRDLLHFSEAQYRGRAEWNDRHSGFAWVPERFDDDRPIPWTAAWSLVADRPVLLPTAYCYYNVHAEQGHAFCAADSNGSAAGNTLAEAVLQGFFELVERDAVAIWWYNRLPVPELDLDSVDDPMLRATRAAYQARNRDLWVLDVTSDLGVPTYVAVSRRHDHREEILQGYGTHADPEIALWRAVTELNQMLAHLGSADVTELEDPDLRRWYTSATVAAHPYLAPAGRREWTPARAGDRSVADEVARCVDLCRTRGLDLLVVDQTRPDVDLHVAKVVVPGLRHFWPRFAPGRLYDVPVALGRRDRPTAEADLNPEPICT
ncbi:TOMM precursor leader peptide-binding protein [Micromonospora endolithica]|uniref:Adenylate cyclase n=1 Tax=Micromonospora endolithica TaxID=230091 RepID=A0A3A9ZIB3_9ACTN|nr:TOMM precursor leader peptide-binding protein [Micromonospora endolithica]RKN47815.1 adenylate cyclase [Micromonospora endolithica]TWJ21498.1 ribosomal protein S12 methylthiotransferase accessory factor [Micromonospora endolithica]